jgi:hypothetical protein
MTFGILRLLLGKVNGLTTAVLALAPWERQQQIGLITFVIESPMELRQVIPYHYLYNLVNMSYAENGAPSHTRS